MITHEEALQYVYLIEEDITNVGKELKKYIAQQQAKEERAKKVEELLKQYQVLVHDYEVLSNNKDRTKLGLLIFAVEEGKRLIKQLEEELK